VALGVGDSIKYAFSCIHHARAAPSPPCRLSATMVSTG